MIGEQEIAAAFVGLISGLMHCADQSEIRDVLTDIVTNDDVWYELNRRMEEYRASKVYTPAGSADGGETTK